MNFKVRKTPNCRACTVCCAATNIGPYEFDASAHTIVSVVSVGYSITSSYQCNYTVCVIKILISAVSELSQDMWSNIWISTRDILEGDFPLYPEALWDTLNSKSLYQSEGRARTYQFISVIVELLVKGKECLEKYCG